MRMGVELPKGQLHSMTSLEICCHSTLEQTQNRCNIFEKQNCAKTAIFLIKIVRFSIQVALSLSLVRSDQYALESPIKIMMTLQNILAVTKQHIRMKIHFIKIFLTIKVCMDANHFLMNSFY